MSEDKQFVKGMFFKKPHEKAPDFVKGQISIKLDEFARFVKDNKDGEWMNIDLKKSKNDKLYLELNTYKKEEKKDDEAIDF